MDTPNNPYENILNQLANLSLKSKTEIALALALVGLEAKMD